MRNKNYSKVLIPLIISIALGVGIYLGNNIGSKSQHNPVYEKVSTILSLIETDYVDSDAEQLRTRISAFLEMLNN